MKKEFISKIQIELDNYDRLQKKRNEGLKFQKLSSSFEDTNYSIEYMQQKFEINERISSSMSNQSEFSYESAQSEKSILPSKMVNKKSKLIWSAVCECAMNSTAHGIPNIFRLHNKMLKVMWTICFLGALFYSIYTITSIVISFLQFDVLTNQQVVVESPVDFPAVTVCNINPFDRRNSQNYINAVLLKNNISYVNDIKKIDINPKLVSNLIKASIKSDNSLNKTQIEHLGFELPYMILTCYFNNLPCNASDFVWTYDYDYTNCYTFNSGFSSNGSQIPIKQSNEAGPDGAFKLELFLGDDEYQNQYILNSGARVVIHNQSVTPIIISEGIDVCYFIYSKKWDHQYII